MRPFIKLESQAQILNQIQNALKSSTKLILLIGKTGSAKTFLLEKLALSEDFYLFKEPLNEKNFEKSLSKSALGKELSKDFSEQELSSQLLASKREFVFLLDEASMYEEALLERVRILSDLPGVRFVLSAHKKQGLFLKEHFKSRLFEVQIKGLSMSELAIYTLEKYGLDFKKASLKWLDKLTFSNLRMLDRLCESFIKLRNFYKEENKSPSHRYLLELCAIEQGLLK